MLFDGIETAKAAVAPGEFQCSAQGEDAGLASGGVKPQDENCATTAITVVTVMLVRAGHDDSPSTSRVMISRSDCSAAFNTPKFFERVSLALVGRVGRSHTAICSGVTARRSKWISESGARR